MELLNRYLSGIIMPVLLIVLGVFFTFRLKFFYVLHPIKTVRTIIKNQRGGLKSLSLALAGTLGIGNIVGVSAAIILGGAGSIFWMWASAFCAMSLKYCEVYLAMVFRKRSNERFYGGAPHYIKEGLRSKIGEKSAYILSIIFALFCVLNSLTTGNLVQINSVSTLFSVSPLFFGIIFTILTFIAISGGSARIGKVTSIIIPLLTFAYVFICLYILIPNYNKIPTVLSMIFKDAFSTKCATGGFTGYGISCALRYGVSRGVLSNEAGVGTSPCAHASSENTDAHKQGCLGIFEVFVDTILLCTLTAFVILLSPATKKDNPMALVLSAFEYYMGNTGVYAVIFLSVAFAFATVICQFFYGIESLKFVSKSTKSKSAFTFIFCLVLLVGAVIPMSLMWQISDLALASMTVINLICLFLLRNHIK